MARYRITRRPDTDGADDSDPFTHLDFSPARDSDEFFEALKESYPQIKKHHERLVKAVVDFYEHNAGAQSQSQPQSQSSRQTTPRGVSPENITGLAGPTGASRVRSASYIGRESKGTGESLSNDLLHIVAEEPSSHREAMHSMIQTFNLESGNPSTARHRRSMNDEERAEYKLMKRVGACPSCRRQKRKCKHPPSQWEDRTPLKRRKLATAVMLDVSAETAKGNAADTPDKPPQPGTLPSLASSAIQDQQNTSPTDLKINAHGSQPPRAYSQEQAMLDLLLSTNLPILDHSAGKYGLESPATTLVQTPMLPPPPPSPPPPSTTDLQPLQVAAESHVNPFKSGKKAKDSISTDSQFVGTDWLSMPFLGHTDDLAIPYNWNSLDVLAEASLGDWFKFANEDILKGI